MATPKCSGHSYGSSRSAAKPRFTSPGAMDADGIMSSRKFEPRDVLFITGQANIIEKLL